MQNLNKLPTSEEKLDFLFKKYAELVSSLIRPFCQIQALVRAEKRRLLVFQVYHYRSWLVTSNKPMSESIRQNFLNERKIKQKN